MKKNLLLIAMVLASPLAFGIIDPPEVAPWYVTSISFVMNQFPEINAWLGAVLMFVMGLMRSLSAFMLFIAAKTENKKGGNAATQVSKIVKWLACIIGWFGLGNTKK